MKGELPTRICALGGPGALRDRLVSALLGGQKTATSSLMVEWEQDAEPLPDPGELQTVVDSANRPVAVIEVLAVDVIRLGDADLELALAEGEGFLSVQDWRRAHEGFWNADVGADQSHRAGRALNDDTQVVVEYFRVLR